MLRQAEDAAEKITADFNRRFTHAPAERGRFSRIKTYSFGRSRNKE
jgi:hypothetical protein